MPKIDTDRWIRSMIENFPDFQENGRIPMLYEAALKDQGLEYRHGNFVSVCGSCVNRQCCPKCKDFDQLVTEPSGGPIEYGKTYKCVEQPFYSRRFTIGKTYECDLDGCLADDTNEDRAIHPSDLCCFKAETERKPKFDVGTYIVHAGTGKIYLVSGYNIASSLSDSFKTGYYIIDVETGRKTCNSLENIERNARQWTIFDARDGDILDCGTFVFIYKALDADGGVRYYCATESVSYDGEEKFHVSAAGSRMGTVKRSTYSPASFERRNELMEGIRNAGYTWDASKLRLRKKDKDLEDTMHKFREGDVVREVDPEDDGVCVFTVDHVDEYGFSLANKGFFIWKYQDMFERIDAGKPKSGPIWHDACDVNDLPEVGRTVLVLTNDGTPKLACRPEVEENSTYVAVLYGAGKWNTPNLRWWADIGLPDR